MVPEDSSRPDPDHEHVQDEPETDSTTERFGSPAEAQEAVLNELTGEQAGPEEYNDERALDDLQDEDERSDPLE